jgi:hypothetical protein
MPEKVEDALLGGLRATAVSIAPTAPGPRHVNKKGNGECLLQNE